jgi:hypothetical protein
VSLQSKDLFHTAIIVPDVDASAAELTRIAGLTWSPKLDVEAPLWTRDRGVQMRRMVAMYSVEAPHLELVTAVPGTLWDLTPRAIHHLGYWSDDLVSESDALEARGLPRVAGAMNDGQLYGFAYHETSDGLLLELVDRAVFPDWDGFLRGEVVFGQRRLTRLPVATAIVTRPGRSPS